MTERIWVKVTAKDNIPVREGRPALVGDREIAIFNTGDGRYLATANHCPHMGGPLCDGIVTGAAVVCPLHAWRVNLEDGSVQRPASDRCVETFPTRLEDDIIVVGLPGMASAEHAA